MAEPVVRIGGDQCVVWWLFFIVLLLTCCLCCCCYYLIAACRRRRRHDPKKSVVQLTKELSRDLVSSKSITKLSKELSEELRNLGSSSYAAVVVEDEMPPKVHGKESTLTVPRRLVSTDVIGLDHESTLAVPRRLVSTEVIGYNGTPTVELDEVSTAEDVSGPFVHVKSPRAVEDDDVRI